MADSLYDDDILAWSEQQADLLRLFVANVQPSNGVDWPNVIEEIEAVGRTELLNCEMLLRQAMAHLVKLHVWPDSQFASEWREEAHMFLDDAQDRCSTLMRGRIDLEKLYSRAVRRTLAATDGTILPRPLPAECPFELDRLLDGDVRTLTSELGR